MIVGRTMKHCCQLACVIALSLVFRLLFGCIPAVAEEQTSENNEEMSYTELYLSCREVAIYRKAYTTESMNALLKYLNRIEYDTSVSEVIAKIESGDEKTAKFMKGMAKAYSKLEKVCEYDEIAFDIWEGHDKLPIFGGTDPNCYETADAQLADNDGYRPVLIDYRLDDPSSAIGTLITIPSVRAAVGEIDEIAQIWNAMGFNVFGLEPRFDTIDSMAMYPLLQLDAQRALRYLAYHAEELQIDPDKFVMIGGSKGNLSFAMVYDCYDMTPTEVAAEWNTTLPGYEDDAIDQEYALIQVGIVSYGKLSFTEQFTADTIKNSRIYSAENSSNNIRFPDILVLVGNYDSFVTDEANVLLGMYDYNHIADKLYEIAYEIHTMQGVPHGFSSGLMYSNVTAQWMEIGTFVSNCLK